MMPPGSNPKALGAARAVRTFCRQFLVKASSVLPGREAVVNRTRAGRSSAKDSSIPARSSVLGQRTHKGSASATAVASQSPYSAASAFTKLLRHTAAPAADKSERPPYPLLMHALDTHQPWTDSEPSEGAGNKAPEWLHSDARANSAHCIARLAVDEHARVLRVHWADGHASRFHFIWLRDHDYADINATNQRRTDTASIPLDISATDVALVAGGRQLKVTWDRAVQGVAVSCFDAAWLREQCFAHTQEVLVCVCVCVCVCVILCNMCVCIILYYFHLCNYTCKYVFSVCMCVCVCMYVCMYTYMHT